MRAGLGVSASGGGSKNAAPSCSGWAQRRCPVHGWCERSVCLSRCIYSSSDAEAPSPASASLLPARAKRAAAAAARQPLRPAASARLCRSSRTAAYSLLAACEWQGQAREGRRATTAVGGRGGTRGRPAAEGSGTLPPLRTGQAGCSQAPKVPALCSPAARLPPSPCRTGGPARFGRKLTGPAGSAAVGATATH